MTLSVRGVPGERAARTAACLSRRLAVATPQQEPRAPSTARVLIVDDDRDVAELVYAILADEGFAVSVLHSLDGDAIRIAVNQLEPDCILLDGNSPSEYGLWWGPAAWIHERDRRVPLIMFNGHAAAVQDAERGESPRSQAAGFASVIAKPFDIDQLILQVTAAVGTSVLFDESKRAEERRTAALVARLEAAGARDVRSSARREWAAFRTEDGTLVQLYFWQRDGVYYVVRHAETGGKLETLGRFFELATAIAMAMTVRQ
jgi:DNA-binding response OmpR family regulator